MQKGAADATHHQFHLIKMYNRVFQKKIINVRNVGMLNADKSYLLECCLESRKIFEKCRKSFNSGACLIGSTYLEYKHILGEVRS